MRSIFISFLTLIQVYSFSQTVSQPIIFQWISRPSSIKILDSLIGQSDAFALNASDYNTVTIKNIIRNPHSILNYKDSLTIELSIQKTATHFFNDLAYGNKPPSLDYRGAKFDMIAYNVPALIKTYLQKNQLNQLVQVFNQNSIEIKKIMDSLHALQKSSKKNQARIALLMKAANDYRWLNAVRSQQRIVLVNIPSAQLKVYEGQAVTLQMNIVLGKVSTPTKTLSTYINQVTINPYWTVPKSIIVNEMLPKIQKDIQYLSNNRLAVLNENYKVMDPYQINWSTIDHENFPYIIRQATGCENALGILKLEFENPFSMYLHDTPEKQLFKNKNRFLSHGCMRMEKPIEMGRLLLSNNLKAIDSLDLTKCDLNQKPVFLPVTIKTPLIVWYSQVDFDSNNNLMFYKNVYNR
jgi:lipoprotein-anchoring transpeptidase ErfK/SrfK